MVAADTALALGRGIVAVAGLGTLFVCALLWAMDRVKDEKPRDGTLGRVHARLVRMRPDDDVLSFKLLALTPGWVNGGT